MPHTTGDLRFETCDSSGEDFLSYAKKERQVFKLTRGQNISIVSYSYLLRSINELQVFLDSRFFFFFFLILFTIPIKLTGQRETSPRTGVHQHISTKMVSGKKPHFCMFLHKRRCLLNSSKGSKVVEFCFQLFFPLCDFFSSFLQKSL